MRVEIKIKIESEPKINVMHLITDLNNNFYDATGYEIQQLETREI